MNLKIGDRVAVYVATGRFTGVLTNFCSVNHHNIFVTEDGCYSCHRDSPFHYKQCRKLIAKKLDK